MPDALRAAGHRCVIHDERFDQQTEDATWLHAVAAESARLRTFIMICGNAAASTQLQFF